MNQKKWIVLAACVAAVLLAGILLFLFFPRSQPVDTDVVGICYRDKVSPENAASRTALENRLRENGLQVIVVDAAGDQSVQLQQIGQLQAQGCDSLLIEPVMTDAAEQLLQTLETAGVPAVLMNRELDQELLTPYTRINYVGTEVAAQGTIQAQMALALPNGGDINGDGVLSYMILQGPENRADATACTQALEAALAASGQEAERVSLVYGDWTLEKGKQLTTQELAAYGKDIEVIFCGNDPMALGAISAIADGGRKIGEDVYLYGMGGTEEARSAVDAGTLSGTVYTDPAAYETAVINAVIAQIKGQTVEKVQIIPYVAVTKSE